MLNRTKRPQVDKVLPTFVQVWSTPESFINANNEDVQAVIKPLGFSAVRAKNLFKMTETYLREKDSAEFSAENLPGIGEYGSRAWKIFCKSELGDVEPKDGSLARYWRWAKMNPRSSRLFRKN